MKTRILHIALVYCLLTNLVFSQAILGFIHDHHDEQDYTSISLKKCGINEAALSKQVAPCKICSLDIIHELFYSEYINFLFSNNAVALYQIIHSEFNSGISLFPKGRAPPFSLLI